MVREGIEEITTIVQGLWDSSLEILSAHGMDLMDSLTKMELVQPRIE